MNFANFYNQKTSEIIKSQREAEENNRKYFDNLLNICKKFEKEKYQKFNPIFINRVLNHNDINYLIISLNFSEGFIKCIKLYDKNGIKIDINNPMNLNNAERFPFEKLYDNCFINTKDDSEKILKSHREDNNNILRIYYELISIRENNNNLNRLISQERIQDFDSENIENEHENNSEDIRMKLDDEEINSENLSVSVSNSQMGENKRKELNEIREHREPRISSLQRPPSTTEQKEIVPYKITPENIDLNNYNIIINDNVIRSIGSELDERLLICFESQLIKEQANNQFAGLVSSSIMKVYTSIYNKDIVNIVHIHLNDTSKEISIDTKFLEKTEKINDHKVFKLDAYGKKLDYKLIFKDFDVKRK